MKMFTKVQQEVIAELMKAELGKKHERVFVGEYGDDKIGVITNGTILFAIPKRCFLIDKENGKVTNLQSTMQKFKDEESQVYDNEFWKTGNLISMPDGKTLVEFKDGNDVLTYIDQKILANFKEPKTEFRFFGKSGSTNPIYIEHPYYGVIGMICPVKRQ